MALSRVRENTGPLSLPEVSFCSMAVLIGQTLDNHEICIPLGTKKTRRSVNGIAAIHHGDPRKITQSQYPTDDEFVLCTNVRLANKKHLLDKKGLIKRSWDCY